jgi:hypothetical protein
VPYRVQLRKLKRTATRRSAALGYRHVVGDESAALAHRPFRPLDCVVLGLQLQLGVELAPSITTNAEM